MATVVSQQVRHLGHHLGFFKNFILRIKAESGDVIQLPSKDAFIIGLQVLKVSF